MALSCPLWAGKGVPASLQRPWGGRGMLPGCTEVSQLRCRGQRSWQLDAGASLAWRGCTQEEGHRELGVAQSLAAATSLAPICPCTWLSFVSSPA